MQQNTIPPQPAYFTRVGGILVILIGALLGVGLLTLMRGVTPIPAEEVLRILLTSDGERVARIVVWQVRLPRFVLGMLAGAALAAAGTLLQDALKNELAEPGLLGVASGASLVVASVVVFNITLPFGALPALALLGGLVAGGVVLIATRLTRDPVRMILIGTALGALFSAMITAIIVLGDPNELRVLYNYLVGSLNGRDWEDVRLVFPWFVVALPISLFLARALNLLQLGDDMAESLGLPVFRTRALIFLVAIALQAAVVAVCGPIGFVALIAPHMVRALLATSDARLVLPVSMLVGALLLTAADLLAREIFAPAELPVGLVTVALGSPIALLLLRRLIVRRAST